MEKSLRLNRKMHRLPDLRVDLLFKHTQETNPMRSRFPYLF